MERAKRRENCSLQVEEEKVNNSPIRSVSDYLRLEDCAPRTVYRLRSRNLAYGAFDGKDGFIGIRKKFGNTFLDTEYHWDYKRGPYGTVKPLEAVAILPGGIDATERYFRGMDGRGLELYIENEDLFKFLEELETKKWD